MNDLIPCEFRNATNQERKYYCRHDRVHVSGNVVTHEICLLCSVYTVPCNNPRNPNYLEQSAPPAISKQVWNLAKSLTSFVADGLTTVSSEIYHERLSICDSCSERSDNRCLQCGCRLSLKARGRAFECPLGKWPKV